MIDYYKTLAVNPNSSSEDIKTSFRMLAFKLHPDKSEDPNTAELFIQVFEAYKVLTNEYLRIEYDKVRLGGQSKVFASQIKDIHQKAVDYSDNFSKFYWWLFALLVFMDILNLTKSKVLASTILLILGVATIFRGLINQTLVDLLLGSGLFALGSFLMVYVMNRFKKELDS